MNTLKLVLVLFMAGLGKAKYEIEGNHWFPDDDPNPDIKTGIIEVEELFANQDAENLANKYTEDCVYVHKDIGVLRGREEVREGYQQIFDGGIAGIHSDVIKEGKFPGEFGPGYRYVMVNEYFFDKDGVNIGNSVVWMVLQQVEGGYETFLKMEMTKAESKSRVFKLLQSITSF